MTVLLRSQRLARTGAALLLAGLLGILVLSGWLRPAPVSAAVPVGGVCLAVDPAVVEVQAVGDTFTVIVRVEAGAQQVNGASAYINFNPAILNVTSTTPGSTLPFPLQNQFDNTNGTVDYTAVNLAGSASGTFILVQIAFQVIGPFPGTNVTYLTFNQTAPRNSDVVSSSGSVLGCLRDGTVLGVTLASFTATPQDDQVRVAWETVSEVNNVGFNLWRGTTPDGPTERLNSALIPAQLPGSGQGFAYQWMDGQVEQGATYYYWLEDVDQQGHTTRHGPVSATAQGTSAVTLADLAESREAPLNIALLTAGLAALGAGAWIVGRRQR